MLDNLIALSDAVEITDPMTGQRCWLVACSGPVAAFGTLDPGITDSLSVGPDADEPAIVEAK